MQTCSLHDGGLLQCPFSRSETLNLAHLLTIVSGGSSKGKKKKVAGPLFQIHWWRVVLDESQAIKNAGTLVAHASHQLQVLGSYACVDLLACRMSAACYHHPAVL